MRGYYTLIHPREHAPARIINTIINFCIFNVIVNWSSYNIFGDNSTTTRSIMMGFLEFKFKHVPTYFYIYFLHNIVLDMNIHFISYQLLHLEFEYLIILFNFKVRN